MRRPITPLLLAAALLLACQGSGSAELGFDLYRQPIDPTPTPEDQALSCQQIEQEMLRLQPLTYSHQPGFYDDPYQGIFFWTGTTLFWPVYAGHGLSAHLAYQERGRIVAAQDRIATLRVLKARMRCFEG
ncbi:MAG: hypothetical protein AB2814_07295 [Candidatus Sedimenticola endophacoides]